jgi:hypothetical protein
MTTWWHYNCRRCGKMESVLGRLPPEDPICPTCKEAERRGRLPETERRRLQQLDALRAQVKALEDRVRTEVIRPALEQIVVPAAERFAWGEVAWPPEYHGTRCRFPNRASIFASTSCDIPEKTVQATFPLSECQLHISCGYCIVEPHWEYETIGSRQEPMDSLSFGDLRSWIEKHVASACTACAKTRDASMR